MFLLEESIKLLWKLVKEGRANKEHTNKQQHEFLKVASKAIRRTLSYIRDENKRDTKTEEELSELWANVALAARPFDSDLAERCYLKGNYWANPNNWSDEEVKNAGIEIERIEIEIRNHFKGEARAKKFKQKKTVEKTATLPKEELSKPKENNQEFVHDTIELRKSGYKKVWAVIIAIIIILGGIWTVIQIRESETFKNLFRDSKGDVYVKKSESLLYRELSPQIKVELISLLQKLRQQYNHINIKISVTSDKGSRVRHRVAEEIAGILASAGFEAKAVSPLIRFTNDTSDVVIKGNESDIELLTQLSKILSRFIKTNTPFSGMKNENFQKGELQIIIAGDPLFSSDGIVTFQ